MRYIVGYTMRSFDWGIVVFSALVVASLNGTAGALGKARSGTRGGASAHGSMLLHNNTNDNDTFLVRVDSTPFFVRLCVMKPFDS
jgi:hypothetical protein